MTSSWAGTGEAVPVGSSPSVSDLLNEAPRSKFHRRTVLVSGVGFFTDAYDLFVISIVATIVATQWHLSTLADQLGNRFGHPGGVLRSRRLWAHRRRARSQAGVHHRGGNHDRRRFGLCMSPQVSSGWSSPGSSWAWASAGTIPVSAVLMSEYSNRKDRGRMVGMVFSMQALGLIVGPLVGLLLLSSG